MLVKGPDDGRAESKTLGLKTDILGRMPCFDVNVPYAPLAVFSRRYPIIRGDDQNRRGIGNPFLIQSGGGQFRPAIPSGNRIQGLLVRYILIAS